jgi:tRNA(Leu) C34 or U34 (ribose-2'-O)-methylase TrmL
MPHGPAEIGVGPWPGEWPAGEQYDADLLAHGDRRNVVDRYQHVRHHPDVPALAAYLREHPDGPVPLWGVDNLPGSLHLETTDVPRRVCFLFGQEGPGLSERARAACDATFSIAQFGSTRSINASAAAAIAMHAWVRAHADLSGEDAWRG